MIYLDHDNLDIVVAIRGLNLGKESDFLLLLYNKLGQTKFDGGFVHNGLLKAAQYVLLEECEMLRNLVEENQDYILTIAGHSLGAGVVTLLAMLAVKNIDKLGGIQRKKIRCFAIAPARCISLNLAVRYADIIYSVVLQLPWKISSITYFQAFCSEFLQFGLWNNVAFPPCLFCQSMLENEPVMGIPPEQKIERQASHAKEHRDELLAVIERVFSLDLPLAYYSSYGTFQETEKGENSSRNTDFSFPSSLGKDIIDELASLFNSDYL